MQIITIPFSPIGWSHSLSGFEVLKHKGSAIHVPGICERGPWDMKFYQVEETESGGNFGYQSLMGYLPLTENSNISQTFTMWLQGWNSGHQTWWQVPLPAEPPTHPGCFYKRKGGVVKRLTQWSAYPASLRDELIPWPKVKREKGFKVALWHLHLSADIYLCTMLPIQRE